jgi:hypothetical protein
MVLELNEVHAASHVRSGPSCLTSSALERLLYVPVQLRCQLSALQA